MGISFHPAQGGGGFTRNRSKQIPVTVLHSEPAPRCLHLEEGLLHCSNSSFLIRNLFLIDTKAFYMLAAALPKGTKFSI
jgi:hypothetical protein